MRVADPSGAINGKRLARQFADPVRLPRLAAVSGERLFHASGVRRNVGPNISHQDRAAFVFLLVVELAAITRELTDDWR